MENLLSIILSVIVIVVVAFLGIYYFREIYDPRKGLFFSLFLAFVPCLLFSLLVIIGLLGPALIKMNTETFVYPITSINLNENLDYDIVIDTGEIINVDAKNVTIICDGWNTATYIKITDVPLLPDDIYTLY